MEIVVSTEKLRDFGPQELFLQTAAGHPPVRRSGVVFSYTELELLSLACLMASDIVDMRPGLPRLNPKVLALVTQSLLAHGQKSVVVEVGKSDKAKFLSDLLGVYASLPYYVQPGFVEITGQGFRLDNGWCLTIKQ